MWNKWRSVLLWCFIATFPTIGIFVIRSLGWLQPLEWTALDIYFQLRPQEAADKRIVIVGFEEKDIQALKTAQLSDKLLAQLLTKIKQQKPRVIGLDFYRDVPVDKDYPELVQVFKTTPNLIGVEKIIGDKYYPKIDPSPVLKQLNQVASVDTLVDGDGVVRRALLFPTTGNGEKVLPNLGLALAMIYLKKQGVVASYGTDRNMLLGKTLFERIRANDRGKSSAGSYINLEVSDYQMLLNYRNSSQGFTKVSITDILSGRVSQNSLRDRIVLIGVTAPSFNDRFSTPYSWNLNNTPVEIPGVELQAQIASFILSSTLEGKPTIKTLDEFIEILWIVSWSGLIIILGAIWQRTTNSKNFANGFFLKLIVSSLVAAVTVVGISYLAFLQGWWIPIIPPFLALVTSPLLIANYTYIVNINERERTLESKVAERTTQLKLNNQQLEQSMHQLKDAQQQMIIQSKLASLGTLMAGIAHEINNPLNFVCLFAKLDIDLTTKLQQEIEQEYEYLPVEIVENIQGILAQINETTTDIHSQAERIKLIIQSMMTPTSHVSLAPEPTDINNLVLSIVKVVTYSLIAKYEDFNVSIKTEHDHSIEQINLVTQDISRALINIIDNACQAAYKNTLGKDISPEVIVSTKKLIESDSLEISIQDNGAGIPQSILDQIFDPFFTTKPPNEGTGLGLYFAHDLIVVRHGGQIKVDSQPGAYTKFTLILPSNNK